MAFSFEIVITYKVSSKQVLDKQIDFEYYQYFDTIRKDPVKFRPGASIGEQQIIIEGSRSSPINIDTCWKSKRSNYKKCIVSSLLYAYNFYKERIVINSIEMKVGNSSKKIDFVQEFETPLPKEYSIDLAKLELLYRGISRKDVSDLLFRFLCLEVSFVNRREFYNAYRAFNSVYTYIYTFGDGFKKNDGKRDTNADKVAILNVLSPKTKSKQDKEALEKALSKSISLAGKFFKEFEKDIPKIIHNWMKQDNVKANSCLGVIGDQHFQYRDEAVITVINQIIRDKYKESGEVKEISRKSSERKIDCLRLIILYALHRRNKMFHGENIDPTFLICDVNANDLNEISAILFQLSIDLVNTHITI